MICPICDNTLVSQLGNRLSCVEEHYTMNDYSGSKFVEKYEQMIYQNYFFDNDTLYSNLRIWKISDRITKIKYVIVDNAKLYLNIQKSFDLRFFSKLSEVDFKNKCNLLKTFL